MSQLTEKYKEWVEFQIASVFSYLHDNAYEAVPEHVWAAIYKGVAEEAQKKAERVTPPDELLNLKTVEYLTECTLATVAKMAMRKTPAKSELRRQISIAVYGLRTLRGHENECERHGRVRELLDVTPSHKIHAHVEQWAENIHATHHPEK